MVGYKKMKCFIQLIGTHCTGKSRVVSSIALSYGIKFQSGLFSETEDNTCMLLGRYTKRPNKNYTGGYDAVSHTTEQRKEHIKKLWESNYKIVMVEGFLLGYFNVYLNWYKTLEPKRKVILIFLEPSLDTIKERLFKRSGGKPWSKKREDHVVGKMKVCTKTIESVINDDFFVHKIFKNEDEEELIEILKYVENETGIKIKSYKTDIKYSLSKW